MRSASASFRGSTPWCCCRVSRSTRSACAPSASSCGATCPARCCPTIRRHPRTADWYSPQELAVLPLSSKSHWDVPVTHRQAYAAPAREPSDAARVRRRRRSQRPAQSRRNPLLERLPHAGANGYIRDDRGRRGGFERQGLPDHGRPEFRSRGRRQPARCDRRAARASARRLRTFAPQSAGAVEAGAAQGGVNTTQHGDARYDTADFNDRVAGNLRVDYLLPSKSRSRCAAPACSGRRRRIPRAALVWGDRPPPSSDHRLVWLDISADGARCPPGSDPTASAPSHPRH